MRATESDMNVERNPLPPNAVRLSSVPEGDDFQVNSDHKVALRSETWKAFKSDAYHQYRELWNRVAREKIELDFPINVDIETTTLCNLRCPYCPRTIMVDAGELSPDGMISREEYAMLIDQAAAMGSLAVKLNYNGEPTVHKDLAWQVEYAKKSGILDVLMNTNGVRLRQPLSEQLLRAGIGTVIVSFDAVNPEIFARQRVGTTIGRVIDNVYEFVRLRNKVNPGCSIRVQMVVMDTPEGREQISGLKAMWGGLVDEVGYSPVGDWVNEEGVKVYPERKGWHCAQPFQRLVLKLNGNAVLCCPDSQDAMSIGNWRTTRLRDLWHGERARDIRRKHAGGNYYQLDRCRKCRYPHI
jgi:radical SAM protein with 4Fe4S-binding SPASM domain